MQKSEHSALGTLVRQWVTVVAVLMAIAVNAISNIYPPAGKNTGEVSNTILGGVLITPAGYAFAIWGLIYLALIAYSLYQALPANRHNAAIAKVSWGLVGACVLQIAWIYVFLTFQFWGSVVLMAGILGCLIFSYLATRTLRPTRQIRWLVQAPISVYFGWITVAAVVNVAGALYAMKIPAGTVSEYVGTVEASAGGIALTVAMLCVSAAISATIAFRYGDAAYPAVTVWALCAIALKHADTLPIRSVVSVVSVMLAIGLSALIVRVVVTGQGRPSR
ncbi:MAG: TspO-related protein [Phormidesmis priestleyi Ana]|uniref:TspO-related protein n=1 Tax=Phormidesmis priestleyi Ana TaxID=1666911 RepID=A0A0P7ZMI4_9CYAN|nr:MAG: TspO-related protein [Phormidesmis priestleyi Ana]